MEDYLRPVIVKSADSSYMDPESIVNVFYYIMQNPKCHGNFYIYNLVQGTPYDYANQFMTVKKYFLQNHGSMLNHMIISFCDWANLTVDDIKFIADRIICYLPGSYQLAYAIHTDTDNLHIHFILNNIDLETGKRVNNDKELFYAFLNATKIAIYVNEEIKDKLDYRKQDIYL